MSALSGGENVRRRKRETIFFRDELSEKNYKVIFMEIYDKNIRWWEPNDRRQKGARLSAFHYRNFAIFSLRSHNILEWEFQLIKCLNAAPCDQSRKKNKNCQFSPQTKIAQKWKNGETAADCNDVHKRLNFLSSLNERLLSLSWIIVQCYAAIL